MEFHSDHIVCEEGMWGFGAAFLADMRKKKKQDQKELTTVRKTRAIFDRRGYKPLTQAVAYGIDLIENERDAKGAILAASKRLSKGPFLMETLDAMYRLCKLPLAHDAVVGGRDMGGVYTEITLGSASKLIGRFEELGLKEGMVAGEIGSGLGTMACHLALVIKCRVVCVEIEPKRLRYGLGSLVAIKGMWEHPKLQARLKKPEFQKCLLLGEEENDRKIGADIEDAKARVGGIQGLVRMVLGDARDVPLGYVTLLNCFDEAFNDDVCEALYDTWASSEVPWGVFYKLGKRPILLRELLQKYPRVFVKEKVPIKKIGRLGGQSTAYILGKRDPESTLDSLKFTGLRGCDTDSLPVDMQGKLYPITESGWRNADWINNYKRDVVNPTCAGMTCRVRQNRTEYHAACYSSIYEKCDPANPGENCNCATALTPLPENATGGGNSTIAGTGLFAKIDIEDGQLVCYYRGRVTKKKPTDCTYVLTTGKYYVDGRGCGNHALINHSCVPNCKLQEIIEVDETVTVVILTLRPIKVNEELSIDYGIEGALDNIVGRCECNAKECRYDNNRLVLFSNLLSPVWMGLSSPDKLKSEQVAEITKMSAIGGDQDGRDQYRIELLKERTGGAVFAVSVDTQQKESIDLEYHLDCDVSKSPALVKGLRELRTWPLRFKVVYADWLWTPLEWWRKHIKPAFFFNALPDLALNEILVPKSIVYLPFNPHTLYYTLVASPKQRVEESLSDLFEGTLLTEDNLDEHDQWMSTQACNHEQFAAIFKKNLQDSAEYITWKTSDIIKSLSDEQDNDTITDFLVKVEAKGIDVGKVRFIKLQVSKMRRLSVYSR